MEGGSPPRAMVTMGEARVPVTLVTGYLGSGKTTLVNAILRNKGHRRIAVVENEFGEINIDGNLVAANLIEQEDLVSLTKGCVCCSLRKDIVKALRKLYQRSTAENKPFDAVLLETTGLADPAPVAFTFYANPWIAQRFKLDSILCVVDAFYTHRNLQIMVHGGRKKGKDGSDDEDQEPVNEAAQQLAFADIILLNKIDLVEEEELQEVKKVAKKINSSATILDCQLNKPEVDHVEGLPMEKVLDLNAFGLEKALDIDPAFMDSDDGENTSSPHVSGPPPSVDVPGVLDYRDKDNETSDDDERGTLGTYRRNFDESCGREPKRRRLLMHDTMGIYSVGITAEGPLHPWRFNMFMRDFFVERHKDIFRSKGVLCIKGKEDQKFVFQGVHDKLTYGPSKEPWKADEPRINRVVFIGKNLDREALKEAFRSCVWTPLPPGWEEVYVKGQHAPLYKHESGITQLEMPLTTSAHVQVTGLESTTQPLKLQPTRRKRVAVP